MIELSKINFEYEQSDFRLQFDSIKADSKKAVALIGPSGCGKTTLMSLIAGILPSQNGNIVINNARINNLTDTQRRLFRIRNIGFVFQDFALLEYLNLYENILHPYRINSALTLDESVKKRANDLAEKVGISKRLKNYPGQTSVGEQQRCAIARALLNEPSVILADEPTGNLDPKNKRAILEILLQYVRDHEATLLVATHDYDLLESFDETIDFKTLS
ncbi:MAG: ABC transporter ATP-binding protein [Deltaproteobacteria bacterium]|nr:ABC transporter ATP-binding protein [Deltaproteobacteria bacterium]